MANTNPARHWCFTLNNPTQYPDDILDELGEVEYAIFQLEQGANATPHYQGYVILPERQRLTQMRRLFDGKAHWEIAKGTPAQNREYCSKKEGRIGEISEIGQIPGNAGQGARTDMEELHLALKNGLSQADYANRFFKWFMRYPNLKQNYDVSQFKARTSADPIHCSLFIGPPGTGKSRLAHGHGLLMGGGLIFRKPPGKWWDGYNGAPAVVLDDFRGSSLSFTDFKLLIDRYPLRVELKGTSCDMAATKFLITSNQEPTEWWGPDVIGRDAAAITRRITDVYYMPTLGEYIYYPNYAAYEADILLPKPETAPYPVTSAVLYDTHGALQTPLPVPQ